MYQASRPLYTQKKRKWPRLLVLAAVVICYVSWALARPLPDLQPAFTAESRFSQPSGSQLAWPAAGQAAAGILGSDLIETHGEQKPVPIASVAKVITALVVLQQKPLALGQQGPSVTLTQADVDLYDHYFAQDGSLVPVAVGEKISEYQMVQALMLPSANNIADTMAIWAFGSVGNYITAANTFLDENGLDSTKVGADASGMSPATTSTATDLIKLGKLAMQNPVLAEIVSQPNANLPVANTVRNVNSLLGTNNIIGIKTGNTDQAGGVFLSASRVTINKRPVTIITAVAQQPDLFSALKTSNDLVKTAQANFGPFQAVTGGDIVGRYKIPWGGTVDAIAGDTINTINWKGARTEVYVNLHPVEFNAPKVGTLVLPASPSSQEITVPIKLATLPKEPSAKWRLTHPFN